MYIGEGEAGPAERTLPTLADHGCLVQAVVAEDVLASGQLHRVIKDIEADRAAVVLSHSGYFWQFTHHLNFDIIMGGSGLMNDSDKSGLLRNFLEFNLSWLFSVKGFHIV